LRRIKHSERAAIWADVKDRVESFCNGEAGRCLYFAAFTVDEIRQRGAEAIVQAGSMQWPMIRNEDDDGICSTHFSFMWNCKREELSDLENERLERVIRVGNISLPEMHVWAAIPETQEFIDFTVSFLPEQAEEVGFKWTASRPPDFLWTAALPPRVVYRPNPDATQLARGLIRKSTGLEL